MTKYFKRTFALSEQGAKDLTKATISCTVSYLVLMLPVILLFNLIEDFIKPLVSGDKINSNIWIYISLSVLVLFLIFVTEYIQYNATYVASYSESAAKRITLAEKLRKLPLSFFGKRDLSDLTTTIMSDTAGLETSFSHYIPEFFGAIAVSLLFCAGIISFNWKLGISLLWVVPVSFMLVAVTKKLQDKYGKKHKASQLELADGIQECIENVRDIKANFYSEKYMGQLSDKILKEEKSAIITELTAGLCVSAGQMILRVGVATSVLVSALMLINNEIDLTAFLIFMLAAMRIFDPLSVAYINLAAMFNSLLQVKRMKEIEEYHTQSGTAAGVYKGYDIVFDNVAFSYNDGEAVLNGASFAAKQGEVTALVGPSGGGKSTAAKLSARFWDITSGKITVGGTDISTVEPEELLKIYSIVFQDVTLFCNTIMENIRIGRRNAADGEVIAAAKAARCDEFVSRLEKGYNTVVGENGSTLSGGERQRISIARALLKDAPIILLDEATASLDVENESLIQSAISNLVKNKTVLIIAHRMRTVAGADKIVVLEKGKVAQQGSPQELMKLGGAYRQMVELQNKSASWRIV